MIKYDKVIYDGKLADYQGREYWRVYGNPNLMNQKDYDHSDAIIQRVGEDNSGHLSISYIFYPAEAFEISGETIDPWTENDLLGQAERIESILNSCRICSFLEKHASPSKRAIQRVPGGVEVTTVEREEIPTNRLLTPNTLAKVGGTIIDTLFEPLGTLTISALVGLWLQYLAGASKDAGVKGTYEQMAAEFIKRLDVPPEKQPVLYDNMYKAYQGFTKSGNISGLGKGFVRSFSQVLNDKKVELKKETKCSTTITAGFIQANGNQLIG